jgi:ppGpp synthetase/RelA/SpoT-type nucleotidyltranferase
MVEWTKPEHSRGAVKRASRTLIKPESKAAYIDALVVVNNWRSAHSYPLQTVMMLLHGNARKIDPSADVVRRLKRLHSIQAKLERTHLDLLQMQDLGGCRAVVNSVEEVNAIVRRLEKSRTKHELYDRDDYIDMPKASGYRSNHLMFKSQSAVRPEYDGLRIEMQIRTLAQHSWATAVETVGLFTRQELKASQGENQWLRFFALMGSAVAHREGCPIVPGTPEKQKERCDELRSLARKLEVIKRLEAYGIVLQHVTGAYDESSPSTFLLVLDVLGGSLNVTHFTRSQQEEAQEAYERAEAASANQPGVDAVLVSADSTDALKRAYPNYFADTALFRAMVAEEIQ